MVEGVANDGAYVAPNFILDEEDAEVVGTAGMFEEVELPELLRIETDLSDQLCIANDEERFTS